MKTIKIQNKINGIYCFFKKKSNTKHFESNLKTEIEQQLIYHLKHNIESPKLKRSDVRGISLTR